MLRQYAAFFSRLTMLADATIAGACFFSTYYQLNGTYVIFAPLQTYLWIFPVVMILWCLLLYLAGIYTSFRLKPLRNIILIILRSGFLGLLIFSSIYFLFKTIYVSRVFILCLFIFTTCTIAAEKALIVLALQYFRRKGFNFRNLLIVGTGSRVQHVVRKINLHREYGLKLVGLVDDAYETRPPHILGHKIIGALEDIPKIICEQHIDIVLFVLPRSMLNKIEKPLLFCETVGVTASVAVDLFNLDFTIGKESHLFGIPLLTFERTEYNLLFLLAKRAIDILLSVLALVVFAPLLCGIGLLIKSTSRGSILFRQQRCGLNGRLFTVYKFRTMEMHAESKLEQYRAYNIMQEPAFKMENDPRVTPVGRFLRKFSLDELPQFWNVLKGEMSVVGPRPPLPGEVAQYNHWQRRRLSMKPGITCLWQIDGRNDIRDFDKWMQLDLEYIDHWSLWRDCQILLKTIPAVFITKGAK